MKKLFATLASLALIATLLMSTSCAMQLVDPDGNPTGCVKQGDIIYFGQYEGQAIPWVMVDSNGLLLSQFAVGESVFRADEGYYGENSSHGANTSSDLKNMMDDLYDSTSLSLFSSLEQSAIKETTLEPDSMFSGVHSVTAHLYPLSSSEVGAIGENSALGTSLLQAAPITERDGDNVSWWLRSSIDESVACRVLETGLIDEANDPDMLNSSYGVRPAFNLDFSSVLFTSSAVEEMDVGSTAMESSSPSDKYKLTLKDESRNGFAATTTSVHGKVLTIAYSGATLYNATTAPNEYISALIIRGENPESVDSPFDIVYYKRLVQPTTANGTLTIDLTNIDFSTGNRLYIISEQGNGDYMTDYASPLQEVAVPYSIETTPSALSFGDVNIGYTQPAAQTVTIKNTGIQSVTVDLPILANYTIVAGTGFAEGTATLAENGDMADFTIRPNAALDVKSYDSTLVVNGSNAVSDTVAISFTVQSIPKTGDNSSLALWGGVMLIAGTGLAAGLILVRRKQQSRQ